MEFALVETLTHEAKLRVAVTAMVFTALCGETG